MFFIVFVSNLDFMPRVASFTKKRILTRIYGCWLTVTICERGNCLGGPGPFEDGAREWSASRCYTLVGR